MSQGINLTQEAQEKQRLFIERARKGVLKFIADSGAPVNMSDLHDFTLKKFFIQHQGFSNLMEGLVADQLVVFNQEASEFILTDMGKAMISDE